jgi:hypothetical protein
MIARCPALCKFLAPPDRTISIAKLAIFLVAICTEAVFAFAPAVAAQSVASPTTWTVTIVLPKNVVAGQPATLAVLGVDGRLAARVAVEIKSDNGNRQRVVTDPTGRGYFTVPASGSVLIARAPGGSAAALIDTAIPAGIPPGIASEPFVSLHDRFSICGSGLRGDADAILVRLNRQPSLVIAASPECIVVLPNSKAEPGPTQISVEASSNRLSSNTTLVSLDLAPPALPLEPGKKNQFSLLVRGSDKRLRVAVENKTPGVLQFLHGDVEEVLTAGGNHNDAALPMEVIRSGDYSFDARLLPAPDPEAARRFLQAAASIAPQETQRDISDLTKRIERHPQDTAQIRESLTPILAVTIEGDFRTLLEAAYSSL